ncbi:MAG: hypothetical protein E5X48_22955 [Mesorhizobium sp.]|nr:MAG: hypothetical protein E5X48_22955 [Mesorhizobium sp.]
MENATRRAKSRTSYGSTALPSSRNSALEMGRSLFPRDAVARICKASRSVTTSGKACTKGWRLVFERRTAPFIDSLMGYTGGEDTLAQIELNFPTLESAVRYAERQGLAYHVQTPADQVDELGSRPTKRLRCP